MNSAVTFGVQSSRIIGVSRNRSISSDGSFLRGWDSDGKSITFSPNYNQTPTFTRDMQADKKSNTWFASKLIGQIKANHNKRNHIGYLWNGQANTYKSKCTQRQWHVSSSINISFVCFINLCQNWCLSNGLTLGILWRSKMHIYTYI